MPRCDSYYLGECTWGACELAGWVPEGLGNAGDWLANAISRGMPVSDGAQLGSVVVYGRGDGYSAYGHCGVVRAIYGDGTFDVQEMNYVAWNTYDTRRSNHYDVLGFILDPNPAPPPPPPPSHTPGGDQLQGAWSMVADYWNRAVPQAVDQLNYVIGILRGIG